MKNIAPNSTKEILAGIFSNKESASKAFFDLKRSGYETDEISIVMSKDAKAEYFGKDQIKIRGISQSLPLPTWTSSGLSGSGPMRATLDATAPMNQKGALRAILIGAGMAVEQASRCNDGLKRGKILLAITPKNADDLEFFSYKWNQFKAEEVYH